VGTVVRCPINPEAEEEADWTVMGETAAMAQAAAVVVYMVMAAAQNPSVSACLELAQAVEAAPVGMAGMEDTLRAEAGEALTSMACSPIPLASMRKMEARAEVAVEMGDAGRTVWTTLPGKQMGSPAGVEEEVVVVGIAAEMRSRIPIPAQPAVLGDCSEGEEDRVERLREEMVAITEAVEARDFGMRMQRLSLALGGLEVAAVDQQARRVVVALVPAAEEPGTFPAWAMLDHSEAQAVIREDNKPAGAMVVPVVVVLRWEGRFSCAETRARA
jgi:hypothetical protein